MKNKNITLHYDEDGDYLEIYFGKIKKGHFRKINKELFERVDEKTGRVVGYAIFNFKERLSEDLRLKIPQEITA